MCDQEMDNLFGHTETEEYYRALQYLLRVVASAVGGTGAVRFRQITDQMRALYRQSAARALAESSAAPVWYVPLLPAQQQHVAQQVIEEIQETPITQLPQTGHGGGAHQVVPTDFSNLFGHLGQEPEQTFEGIFGEQDTPGASSSSGPVQPTIPVLIHHHYPHSAPIPAPTVPSFLIHAPKIPPPTVPSFLGAPVPKIAPTTVPKKAPPPAYLQPAYGPKPTMSNAAKVRQAQASKHPSAPSPYAKTNPVVAAQASKYGPGVPRPVVNQQQPKHPPSWHGSAKPTRRKKIVIDNSKSFLPFHDIADDPYFIKV